MELAHFAQEHLWSLSLVGLLLLAGASIWRASGAVRRIERELRALRGIKAQAQRRMEGLDSLGDLDALSADATPHNDPYVAELRSLQRLVVDATHQGEGTDRGDISLDATSNQVELEPGPAGGLLKVVGTLLVLIGLATLFVKTGLHLGLGVLIDESFDPAGSVPPSLWIKLLVIVTVCLLCIVVHVAGRFIVAKGERRLASEREAMVAMQTLAAYATVLGERPTLTSVVDGRGASASS